MCKLHCQISGFGSGGQAVSLKMVCKKCIYIYVKAIAINILLETKSISLFIYLFILVHLFKKGQEKHSELE